MAERSRNSAGQLGGHPAGLFVLFFAEMWERFSFYGMRALLTFYMIKGFLGLNDVRAYEIYGAYTALVYMTPYLGGLLADRLLGRRKSVILGGVLMALGHLLMTIETHFAFFTALGLLIAGNGFFKPNISTIVSELYERLGIEQRKDSGFTIFYMGINLGAAMAPVLCGYIGETYGWHYGFGLATLGMLTGLAIFVMPTRLTQILIGVGVGTSAIAMPLLQDSILQLAIRIFLSLAVFIAGIIAIRALDRGAFPRDAGAPPDPARLRKRPGNLPLSVEWWMYLLAPAGALLLGFAVRYTHIAEALLMVAGILFLLYIGWEVFLRGTRIEKHRTTVMLVLFAFNMLFWMFFEQAGSSLNNWTDRNIDRVPEKYTLTVQDVGKTLLFRIAPFPRDTFLRSLPLFSQEQLGYINGHPALDSLLWEAMVLVEQERNQTRAHPVPLSAIQEAYERIRADSVVTLSVLTYLREAQKLAPDQFQTVPWTVVPQNVGMGIGYFEIPASEFQAANPIYILIFGLLFSSLWSFLARRGRDPSVPIKFGLGLVQLGLGFGIFWLGSTWDVTERGMTSMIYLLLGWMIITMGELCLSPVGLSMVTRLSPGRLVSTMMGGWFLASSFANLLAGKIAALTGAEETSDASSSAIPVIPPPQETMQLYADVFGGIGVIAIVAGILCMILAPWLRKWMHEETHASS